jgi:O-antigen/teichoic acid export membrane protein
MALAHQSRRYNDPLHPFITAISVFPLFTIAMSFVLAWLTRESRSVSPAALAHGANNVIGSAFLIVPNGWTADVTAGLAGAFSIALIVVLVGTQRPVLRRKWRFHDTGSGIKTAV